MKGYSGRLGTHPLCIEDLSTILTEAESILNSRPPISAEADEQLQWKVR